MKHKNQQRSTSEQIIEYFFLRILAGIKRLNRRSITMAQTVQDLQNAITAVDAKVDALAVTIADLSDDFDAAVAKLEADIASGADLTPAVTALSALSDKLGTASDSLKAIDVKAETVSGKPTP